MTPAEKTVVRAIAKALGGKPSDMDALATSYALPKNYYTLPPKVRARLMLTTLADSPER